MKKVLLILLSTCAASAHAWKPEFYAGSNYGSFQFEQSEPRIDANFTMLTLDVMAGIRVMPYVTFEGRVGTGLNRDSETVPPETGTRIEVETKYFASVYFRPELRNDKASLYGLLGYTTMEFDGEPQTASSETKQDGLSAGIGIGFVVHERVDVRLEWKRIVDSDSMGARGGSVGFTYTF